MYVYCLTKKKVVFMAITSTKTYGPQRLANLYVVHESEPLNSSDRYAVVVLKNNLLSAIYQENCQGFYQYL